MGRIFVVITLKDDGTYEQDFDEQYAPANWNGEEVAKLIERIEDIVADMNDLDHP